MALDTCKAAERFVVLDQLLAESVFMTTRICTRGKDRNVGLKAPQRRCFCNIDVAGGAFGRMILFITITAAIVPKLH